ncbi:MAG TPA: hypothetical protein VFJ28_06870 [Marmoricola sp.]|nr:hypothetical protein [Marmoricola sp.]
MPSRASGGIKAFFGVSLAAVLTMTVLLLEVPSRIADLGSGNLERLTAPTTTEEFGTPIELAGRGERPPLAVRATSPVPVRVRGPRHRPAATHRHVGVVIEVENLGTKPWRYAGEVQAADGRERLYSPIREIRRTDRGRTLQQGQVLRPGRALRRLLVLEVPRRVRLSSVKFTVGSGLTRSAEWVQTRE